MRNESVSTHWTYLAVALTALVAPFFLSCSCERDGPMLLAQWRLPPACVSKQFFNAECPGCGLTHAFVQLVHGELRAALHSHRLAILLYLYFAAQAAYRIYALRSPETAQRGAAYTAQRIANIVVFVALLGNWLLGFALGANGS